MLGEQGDAAVAPASSLVAVEQGGVALGLAPPGGGDALPHGVGTALTTPASHLNADLDGVLLLAAADPTPAAARLLSIAGDRLQLSARAFHRVLRVARTIADLDGEERVGEQALAEALRFRSEPGR